VALISLSDPGTQKPLPATIESASTLDRTEGSSLPEYAKLLTDVLELWDVLLDQRSHLAPVSHLSESGPPQRSDLLRTGFSETGRTRLSR
jgi:hypothetical protein